jgi:protein-tyrosine sulfotransferase
MISSGFKNITKYCAKYPEIFVYIDYLYRLLPNAKFIYMIRDARASAYSLKVTELSQNQTDPKLFNRLLIAWYKFNIKVGEMCTVIGRENFLPVNYENLILNPEKTLKQIMLFLNETWTNDLLKHQNYFGEKNRVVISSSGRFNLFNFRSSLSIRNHLIIRKINLMIYI